MKRILSPAATLTTLTKTAFTLLCCTLLMVFSAPAQTPQQVKADPGNNDGPPAGAILDLNGLPIPTSYQSYTVNFQATLSQTAITFAFRNDPSFIYFTNASVTDLTNPNGNLLLNSDFSGGVYTSGNNSSVPNNWTYANNYGATFGGVVDSDCGLDGGYCWYDGAVQAYDAISQTIATNPGDTYQISFYVQAYGGTTFSDVSTNGDTTDTGGNGIDVTVYAQAGLPPPNQQLTLTLAGMGTGAVTDNQGASGIGTCSEANGVVTQTPLAMPPAATGTCSASYPIGTSVTLTASATYPSTFVGWSSTTGACSGSSATCSFTMNSAENVTANFMAPPTSYTFPLNQGSNVTATGAIGCPGNPNPTPENPCTAPNGVGASLTIPQLPQSLQAMLTFTEIDPDGLCPAADIAAGGQSGDFDCRLLTYSQQQNYGLDPSGDALVPLCYPYANGNCVVISLTDQNGNELPVESFPQGVFLDFTFNNDQYTPTGYWAGSTPRLFIDPGSDEVTPSVPWGTNCSTAMNMEATSTTGVPDPNSLTGYSTPTNPPIYCQFDADITAYYNPLEPVDGGIGTKLPGSGSDFVVAFKPTNNPNNPNFPAAPAASAPMFTSANSATFTEGIYGSFPVTTTGGYPAPSLSIAPLSPTTAVPAWLTLSPVGLLGGTPPDGAAGSYSFAITATSTGSPSTQQSFTLTVGAAPLTIVASGGTMIYGGTVPTITPATVTGLVNGDTASIVSCSTTATSSSAVGNYPISCTVSASASMTYSIACTCGAVTITPAALSITAGSVTKNYGTAVTLTAFTTNGLLNSDTVSSVTLTSAGAAASATVAGSPYVIVPSNPLGTGLTNYTITYNDGLLTVSPVALLITASSPTITQGTTPVITPIYSGFVNGDTPASLTTAPTCTTSATSSSPPGTYPTSCTGAADLNYRIGYATGVLTIIPAPVTLTATPMSLTFATTTTPLYPGQIGPCAPANNYCEVTVTNPGSSSIKISSIAIGGANSNYFGDLGFFCEGWSQKGGTLAPGASCPIFVDAWLVPAPPVTSASPFIATAYIAITPQGGSAIDVQLTTYVINPVASFSASGLSQGKLTFPTTTKGKSSQVAITVKNTGTTPLIFSNPAISGVSAPFSASTTCSGDTVQANSSCTITVTFAPTANGTFTGTLKVSDNAENGPQIISLSGTT